MVYEFIYEKVLRAIKASEGLTASQVVELISDEDEQSVRSSIGNLKKRGCIEVIGRQPKVKGKRGADPSIFQVTDVPYEKTSYLQVYTPVGKKELKAKSSELEQLKSQVRDLEIWKREALRRFPELAIPEDILEARKRAAVVAKLKGYPDLIDPIISGARDHTPIVQNALKEVRSLQ